jgi:hypothetical protein
LAGVYSWPRGLGRLIGCHANGIDGGDAAAAVALKAHTPGVAAVAAGRIRGVGGARHNIPTADRMLTGRTRRQNDHSAVARQRRVIVDDLIAAGSCWCRRLVRRSPVADRNAGDKRSNPPRFFEKPDQTVPTF